MKQLKTKGCIERRKIWGKGRLETIEKELGKEERLGEGLKVHMRVKGTGRKVTIQRRKNC